MKHAGGRAFFLFVVIAAAMTLSPLLALPALAGGYDSALKGVTQVKAVFDYSQGSPKMSNVLFWAVRNVYQDESVRALPNPPRVVIVFSGAAVKLLSTDRKGFEKSDLEEFKKFDETIRQMKRDGVKMEVCLYAAEVLGVDPATILPEIDHVGNGFVSVVGYQAQGFSVVRIP